MRQANHLFSRHRVWLSATGAAAAFLLSLIILAPPAADDLATLRGAPSDGSIYFMGNSMFGTGLDIELVRQKLPGEQASFGYYDGHYSSMWYAAIRNSLIPSGNRPKVIVWGFRPTYAVLPAFRQNQKTALDALHDPEDPIAVKLLALGELAADSASGASSTKGILGKVTETSEFLSRRSAVKDYAQNLLAKRTAVMFSADNDMAQAFADEDANLKISDVVTAFATKGAIRRADALVIDNGERFIRGVGTSFEDSFIPHTAALLAEAGVPQLVVIFKPVSEFDGTTPAEAVAYYQEAVDYLKAKNIPYVDLFSDNNLTEELYAKGDHFTHAGMQYVTTEIIAALQTEGLL
ncbi:MAG: hypothetical protein AAGJ73_08995 [Pseudomonadota bacterium]